MHKGSDFGSTEHRERGRGRKAFWILVWVAVAAAILYATQGLLNEVRLLYHQIVRVGETLHTDEPVTLGMRGVLEFLQGNGPATVPDIARSRSVTRQHIQMLVNSLLDSELVTLQTNPQHKRSSLVALTPDGLRIIRRMRRREARFLDQTEFGLRPARIRETAAALAQVRAALEEQENS